MTRDDARLAEIYRLPDAARALAEAQDAREIAALRADITSLTGSLTGEVNESARLEVENAALRADVTRLTASLAAAEAEAGRLREAVKPFAGAWWVAVDLLKSRTLADIETLAKHHTPGGAYQRAAALSDPAS